MLLKWEYLSFTDAILFHFFFRNWRSVYKQKGKFLNGGLLGDWSSVSWWLNFTLSFSLLINMFCKYCSWLSTVIFTAIFFLYLLHFKDSEIQSRSTNNSTLNLRHLVWGVFFVIPFPNYIVWSIIHQLFGVGSCSCTPLQVSSS